MITSIPRFLLLIYPWMEFWFVRVVPKYLNYSTVSNDSLTICMYPFCPAFWSRNMTIYLVFSAFTSKPISLLAISKTSQKLCQPFHIFTVQFSKTLSPLCTIEFPLSTWILIPYSLLTIVFLFTLSQTIKYKSQHWVNISGKDSNRRSKVASL
jgi:hypothetical protein